MAGASSRVSSKYGYTLAEVLLSLGICVTFLLTAVDLSISALRSNQKSTDQMTAEALAGQSAELFIYGLPSSSSDPFWSTTTYSSPYLQDSVTLGNSTFSEDIYLTDLSSVTVGLKEVKVVVSWGSGAAGRTGYGSQAVEATRVVSWP